MKTKRYLLLLLSLLLISFFILSGITPPVAMAQTTDPVDKTNLVKVVRSREFSTAEMVRKIEKLGVNFELTAAARQELTSAGARSEVIAAVQNNYRAPQRIAPVRTQTATNTTVTPVRNTSVVNSSPVNNPIGNNYNDSGSRYDALYNQAIETYGQIRGATNIQQATNIVGNARNLALQAIQIDPTRPDAYKVVAFTSLMTGNGDDALRYAQEAINRGGSVYFPLYHFHGEYPNPENLYITNGGVSLETQEEYHLWKKADILNMQLQQQPGYIMQKPVAVFGFSVYRNGQPFTYYFVPGNTGTPLEANLIMRLIQQNVVAR